MPSTGSGALADRKLHGLQARQGAAIAPPPAEPTSADESAPAVETALPVPAPRTEAGHAKPARTSPEPRMGRRKPAAARTAPPLDERQGQTRFQARLTPTLGAAVTASEAAIARRTGLSLNAIRQIAVWHALADSSPEVIDRFVHELWPAYDQARREATIAERPADS